MAITINGLETRFLKPKGGENPFKSAKPFDDNIDYNSLEDGDLFYIELKEEFIECDIAHASIVESDPTVKNIIGSISSNGITYNAYDAWQWPPGVRPNIANIHFDESYFLVFVVHRSDNIDTNDTDNKTIGVFLKPQSSSLDSDINHIPTHLGKTLFEYWKGKLPTIILGLVAMYYRYGLWGCVLDTELVQPCLIGNIIVSFEIEESSTVNRLKLKLDTLLLSNYYEVRQLMPIYFLNANSNSYRDNRGEWYYYSFDMNAVSAIVHQANDSTYTIETEYLSIYTGRYAEDLYEFFTTKYDDKLLSEALISYYYNHVVKQYLLNSKFYLYAIPDKIYIIYNNGIFSTLEEHAFRLVTAKTYLKIIEYFENHPDSSMKFTTSEFIQLFNIKPIGGKSLIASLIYDGFYSRYLLFREVFSIKFVDRDHVEIHLAEGYSNSASSQELLIGEFEE